MRRNTYIKLETLYNKYSGYVGTKELLAEGFTNRQISVLVEEGYYKKYVMDITGLWGNNAGNR